MSNQEFTIHIKRQPQLPLILAFPLVIVLFGILVTIVNFVGSNFVELTSFIFVPLIAWFAIGRRMRRTGHPVYALIAVMGSGLVTLSAFQIHAAYQHRQHVAAEALRAKIYAEEAPKREADYKKTCLEGVPALKNGVDALGLDLDYCAKYFTRAETMEICRPLILAHAVPRNEWTVCKGFVDEVKSQSQRMRNANH